MKKYFSTPKEKIIIDIIPFSREEFTELILSERPSEIYHSQWSNNSPFIYIGSYDNDKIEWKYYDDVDYRKSESVDSLYSSLIIQGLKDCYIDK